MPEEAGISIKQVTQQARNENGLSCNLQATRRRGMHCQLGHMELAVKRSGGVGKWSEYEAGSELSE